jgi:hypothetical protein
MTDDKAIQLKKQLQAFAEYQEKGLPYVKKFYPDQYEFVLANKEKSFQQVALSIDDAFAATTQH